MTRPKQTLVELSKLMSLVLRHDPASFGVTLDPEGFLPIADLVAALRTRLADLTAAEVVEVVETIEPDKRRFSIEEGEIRANYGHSFADRIAQARATPPEILWHGTIQAALSDIFVQGLLPMRRQYVHLAVDRDLARRVGARRGAPRLLRVESARAFADGVIFYRANSSFWLADSIPPRYLSLPDTAAG